MTKYTLGDLTVQHWHSWDKIPRATVVGNMIIQKLGLAIAPNTFAATLLGAIVITPIVSWAVNALMPKPDMSGTGGLLANTRDAAAPQQLVYGTVRKGGTITYMESTGETNKFLHMFICLAGHEVNAIGDIYVNDVNVSAASDYDNSTYLVGGDWSNKIYIRKFLGAANQNIYSDMSGMTDGPSWQVDGSAPSNNEHTNFKGEGVACLYVRLEYDQDVFAEGIPQITAVVQGKKVLDPRNSSTAFSANAALCIQDYLSENYGLSNSAYVGSASFSAAANTCDENVNLSGSGTEKRYEINGVINLSRTPRDILSDMMAACAGTLFWGQGEWHLKVGEYTSSVKTFTLDDFRSEISLDTKASTRDNFNIVRGVFNDATQDYLVTEYPEKRSTTFIAEDAGLENALDFPLPLTTSHRAAQRLAKLTLFRSREQMIVSADFSLEALEVECGDTIALTVARYGWNAKEFEVISWKLYNGQDAGDLKVHLVLRETSSAVYNWSAEESALAANNSTLGSSTSGLTPSNVTVTDKGTVQTDGTFVGQALVQWTKATNKFLNHYEIEWKPTTESSYQRSEIGADESSAVIGPLEVGTQYNVRIRGVTVSDVRGSYVSATAYTHGGDTTAPSPASSLSATGGAKFVTLDWTAPTTQAGGGALYDLKGYNIYRATSNSQPTNPIAFAFADKFTDTALAVNTQYYYWIEAVDFTGNKSTLVTANATTDATTGGADTDTSVYSGILYYSTLQSSAPSAPTNNTGTFSVSGGNFSTPPTGWSHSQTTVSNTSFVEKEWTVSYTVEADVGGSVTSIKYGAVNGAFQITDTIESSNFSSGSAGWQIKNDGTVEFGSAAIRDTLTVGQIPNLSQGKILNLGTDLTAVTNTANSASSTATTANNTANSASTAATNAQSTADDAVNDAAAAQSTANTGVSNAATAQSTANTALSTANSANSTANSANTTALGKATVFYQNGFPSSGVTNGDLLFHTGTKKYYHRVSGSWSPAAIEADTIVAGLLWAGTINGATINAGTITADKLTGITSNATYNASHTIYNPISSSMTSFTLSLGALDSGSVILLPVGAKKNNNTPSSSANSERLALYASAVNFSTSFQSFSTGTYPSGTPIFSVPENSLATNAVASTSLMVVSSSVSNASITFQYRSLSSSRNIYADVFGAAIAFKA